LVIAFYLQTGCSSGAGFGIREPVIVCFSAVMASDIVSVMEPVMSLLLGGIFFIKIMIINILN